MQATMQNTNWQSADIFAICSGAIFVGRCDENSDDTSWKRFDISLSGLVILQRARVSRP